MTGTIKGPGPLLISTPNPPHPTISQCRLTVVEVSDVELDPLAVVASSSAVVGLGGRCAGVVGRGGAGRVGRGGVGAAVGGAGA